MDRSAGRESVPIVLLVDDNLISRYSTQKILKQAGFHVLEASSGKEALELVRGDVDLVVLDINLPDMDGYEVCRQLKSSESTRHIPVLHLTATYISLENKIKGLDGGADGYLIQPVKPAELVATVRSLLRMSKAEEDARKELQIWQASFDSMGDAICVLDTDGKIRRYNKAFAELCGKSQNEIIGSFCSKVMGSKTDCDSSCPLFHGTWPKARETWEIESFGKTFHASLDPVLDGKGRVQGYVHILRDITALKKIETALRESEDRFRRLADNAQDLIYRYDFLPEPRFTYVSPSATRITGYTPEEHYADPFLGLKIVHPEDRHLLEQTSKAEIDIRRPLVFRWIRKDGTIIWTEQRNIPLYDEEGNLVAIEGIARDVTEQKEQEAALLKTIKEKESLLQELFHRTRNNMQVILSLLHLQEDACPQMAPLLKTLGLKIQIMALAHQKLIDTDNLSYLSLSDYLQDIVYTLRTSMTELTANGKQILIEFQHQGPETPILLDTAIPLGLALEELARNAVVHGFSAGEKGTLFLRSAVIEGNAILIEVEDTGKGVPESFSVQKNARTGLALVHALVCEQLGGNLLMERPAKGLRWKILLEREIYSPRV